MALKQTQVLILAGGGLAAYLLLKKPKAGQAPNALQKALGLSGYAGSGQVGGGAARPTTTNLATNYGKAALPGVPSLQGFGANPIQSLIGGFANLAGTLLRTLTGKQAGSSTPVTGTQPRTSGAPSGGSAGGGGGSSPAQRPGSSYAADQFGPNIFGGKTTVGSIYNPADYVGINPDTGLYDPAYDPSVVVAGYWDSGGNWVQGEAPAPIDYSQLPGYGTALPVLDENGYVDPNVAPALGQDTGTAPFQVGGQLSGPDDAGFYYYPDGSIAYGMGEASGVPDASYGAGFVGPTQEEFPQPYTDTGFSDFSVLPGAGTALPEIDPSLFGSTVDDSYGSSEDTAWYDEGGG